jgi:hypothetical protein
VKALETRPGTRSAPARWIAFLAFASLAAGVLAPLVLTHTDDGCEIELHCIACRTVVGHERFVLASPAPAPVVEDAAPRVDFGSQPRACEAFDAAVPSRAPPARI